jgi:hypothetical protein
VWAESVFTPDQFRAYLDRNQIPWLPASTEDFKSFFESRRAALAQLIKITLSGSPIPEHQGSAADVEPEELALNTSIESELAESAFSD